MSIKVKEVLELAQSKGCTLAAGEGGIDRIVRFVDCMEIPDMKAWMRPNVLYITTGYAYSDTKEEIMNLIRNLYEQRQLRSRQNIDILVVFWMMRSNWLMNYSSQSFCGRKICLS